MRRKQNRQQKADDAISTVQNSRLHRIAIFATLKFSVVALVRSWLVGVVMEDRGHLITETRNLRSMRLDQLSTGQIFDLMNAEDQTVAKAVSVARADICRAIELVVAAFERGGRLIYVGAGTSGRLSVLDAAECPPTFLSESNMVQGIIAGGKEALTRSIEGAEDRSEDAKRALDKKNVGPNDVVMSITTGGTTPFVHAAVEYARNKGAKTIFFACVPAHQVMDEADVSIRVITGPEVLTGSTRLKAGTATKMVLNMITTTSMVRIGKVYENLMVDVNSEANVKLVDRAVRIIRTLIDLDRESAELLLNRAGGRVKAALVMHEKGVSRDDAEKLLEAANGKVAQIIGEVNSCMRDVE